MKEGFTYAFSLTHHHQDAQDLVQTAAMRVISKKRNLSQRGYFYRTIRNLFYDQVKRGKVIPFIPLEEEHEPKSRSELHPGVNEDLNLALAQLSPEDRELLYLHAVEGRTAEELSKALKCSRNTVLSRIHRAKTRLKDWARSLSSPDEAQERAEL